MLGAWMASQIKLSSWLGLYFRPQLKLQSAETGHTKVTVLGSNMVLVRALHSNSRKFVKSVSLDSDIHVVSAETHTC